jgi:hypothetical protein
MVVAKVLCTHVWRVDRARQYWLIGFLDLLGTPASVFGLTHVGRGLDGGNELESDVGNTGDTHDAASNLAENAVAHHQRAEEDVEDATADEREHERRMSRNLRGDLELKKASNKTKDDHVSTQDDGLKAEREDGHDTTEDDDDTNGQVDNAKDVGGLHVHYVFWGKGFVPKDCAGDDSRSIEFKGEGR